jgi:hypothetical protein
VAVFKFGDWDRGLLRIWGKLGSGVLQSRGLGLGASKNLRKIRNWRSSISGLGLGTNNPSSYN